MKAERPWILITGGTRGIGHAVASLLSRKGYNLILTYKEQLSRAEETQKSLVSESENMATVHILKADSSQKDSIDEIRTFVQEHQIKLRSIIFNAGSTYRSSFEDLEWSAWNDVFTTHVHWPIFCLQALLPYIETKGCILFTGSLMAIRPHGTSLPYGISKSAVHSLVNNLVKTLEPFQIRVNGIAPGFIATEWHNAKTEEHIRNINRKIALHRFALPEEIADAYLFLLESTYANGTILELSGGYDYQ